MRHRLHSICPYFAMFPEILVKKNLIWSEPGDVVLDPFCGRGTTILESLLADRAALGCDVNPVAVCLSRAKAFPPSESRVLARLQDISEQKGGDLLDVYPEFFRWCFEMSTFKEIIKLKNNLNWRENAEDCFIAAVTLGVLHGESHKTSNCLSNRMPRTISTKPKYSVNWWKEKNEYPPKRDVFRIVRDMIEYRYYSEAPERQGRVEECDARNVSDCFSEYRGQVRMVITSPPYLNTTSFAEDQWLRLWFLGGPDRPEPQQYKDDRYHDPQKYWKFLSETWSGMESLLAPKADIVVRIGGKRFSADEVTEGLMESFDRGFSRPFSMKGKTTSESERSQSSVFRPGGGGRFVEYDFHIRIE